MMNKKEAEELVKQTRHRGRNGNSLAGDGCQINFDMLLTTIRMAHYDKVNELRVATEIHWSEGYDSHGYHHHTRGDKIEMLGGQLARLSHMLHMLQGMNDNKARLTNFHWVYDIPEEIDLE